MWLLSDGKENASDAPVLSERKPRGKYARDTR